MKSLFVLFIICATYISCKKEDFVGTYTYYTSKEGSWNLIVDGVDLGELDYSELAPECGDTNFITVQLDEGMHNIRIIHNVSLTETVSYIIAGEPGCHVKAVVR